MEQDDLKAFTSCRLQCLGITCSFLKLVQEFKSAL